jgi:hypothetical protein
VGRRRAKYQNMKSISSMPTYKMLGFLVFALCLVVTVAAQTQQAHDPPVYDPAKHDPARYDPPTNQDEVNKQLLRRLQELEEEVKQLKAQSAVPPVEAALAPEPPRVVEAPAANEVAPRLKLTVFGDVGGQVYNHTPDTFLFGSLDLFMTARLSDKVSALGAVLFIAQNNNVVTSDVERLLLQYRSSDYFTVAIGRYHSWVGYYNSTFNYGEFLETTTDRPFIYAFDDQGGVLPMQEVGVTLTGKIPSGRMGLHYVMEAGNGRTLGPGVEAAQNNQDSHNSKSINGGLFVRPESVFGLQLGFSVRYDNLSIPGPAVGETIATVHGVFIDSTYEILNEGVLVRHVEPSGPVFNTSAFYTQFSRRFRAYRPYFRYQYFNADDHDPAYLFAGQNNYAPVYVNGFVGRVNGPSAGIRYDFTEHSALKLQYDRISERNLPTVNGMTSQIGFTF